jgi:hypothetical protein
VLTLGDAEAASLGIRPARVRLLLLAAASLATAAAVAVSGLIGFVGIVVPHLVRILFRGGLPGGDPAFADRRRGPSSSSPTTSPARHCRAKSRSAWSRPSPERPSSCSCCGRSKGTRNERTFMTSGERKVPFFALRLRDVHSGYTADPVVRGVLVDVPEGGWLGNRWAERRREVDPAQDHGRPAARGRGDPHPRKARHLVVAYGKSRQLRYTPQDPALPEGLTVTDYVMLGRTSARSPAQACEICPLWTMCWPGSTSEDWPDAADTLQRRAAARRAGQGPRPANRPAVTVISRLTQPEQVAQLVT